MGVCLGYMKRREIIPVDVCFCSLSESERERDRVGEYASMLCERKRQRQGHIVWVSVQAK